MTEPLFTLTPSFISRTIRQSRELKSPADVLSVYGKIAKRKSFVLDDSDANNVFSRNDDKEQLISDNIPEELRPFADALFGAVSAPENEEELETL